ncbi:MAG: dTDP-4-dehydrorhamnose 3,5-epimerase [Bacteroidales bacterium]|nr:dTDP-4-dehydrorhamnose 3,5-epimerase [Bacteroidales bacterium]
MEIKKVPVKDCLIILPKMIMDERGRFVKPYHIDELNKAGIGFEIKEEYYSISKKNVLRGMHFQVPPRATIKLITCLNGTVFDAVIDLRKDSTTYRKCFTVELSSESGNMILIPKGFAHGFLTLSEEATVLYMCSEMYSPDHDSGIRWDSANIRWPVSDPVVSEKDKSLTELKYFENPF